MDYCYLLPDLDEGDFYYGEEPEIDVRYCPTCKMVTNRDEAIILASQQVKYRKKRFLFLTNDGVIIVSERFYELYHAYQMNGIEFIPMKKTAGQYICRFINIVRFDVTKAEYLIDNGICSTCGRSRGYHCPHPYQITEEDEKTLKPNTFYRSDIEFSEDNYQFPLIWATSGVVQAFTAACCQLLYQNILGDFGNGDCAKQQNYE